MTGVIQQNRSNKFTVISLILTVSLFMLAGLFHSILGNAFIIIPILTIAFGIISIMKSNKRDLGILGTLGIILGSIYVVLFIYQNL